MRKETRRVIFRLYRRGAGPVFYLTLWNTGRRGENHEDRGSFGKRIMGYSLKMDKILLFRGEDFFCSPFYEPCSDASVEEVMGFLTLRPGDTDDEYFRKYTEEQLAYCEEHAETLAAEVTCRFGKEE